jgi:uncharacterized radical SAM superfamily protein
MAQLSAYEIWNANEAELSRLLDAGTFSAKHRKVRFYAPSFAHYKTSHYSSSPIHFPTISVTGKGCALNCKHCGGRVLQTMRAAETPERLLALCAELKRKGALGCLISGGCLPNGSVPLEKFIPTIARIKSELALTVFVHTGIVNSAVAEKLRHAGADAALIDVIGSDETIREICDLNVTVRDYEDSLKALHQAGLDFVPHVIVGLHHGELKGELAALSMIARHQPSAVVIIAFMPIRGTAMANTKPPAPKAIAKVAATARLLFPETPLVLGCMRPKGRHRGETDVLALKAGVDGIAFPSEEAVRFAENHGYETVFSSFCCAQIYKDLREQRRE